MIRIISPAQVLTAVDLKSLPVWRVHFNASKTALGYSIAYPSPSGLSNLSLCQVEMPSLPVPQGAAVPEVITAIAHFSNSIGSWEQKQKSAQEAVKALINYSVKPSEIERVSNDVRELFRIAEATFNALVRKESATESALGWQVIISS